jgi:quinol monooxygenase YgiN
MELSIFARFHVRKGREVIAAAVLRQQAAAVLMEPGCIAIQAYGSIRDPRLFYIYSRWTDEAAFEIHADLPRTVEFIKQMKVLIDHPFEATRARPLA